MVEGELGSSPVKDQVSKEGLNPYTTPPAQLEAAGIPVPGRNYPEQQSAQPVTASEDAAGVSQPADIQPDASYDDLYGKSPKTLEAPQPGTMAYLQKFLEKRKSPVTKDPGTQGQLSADRTEAYLQDGVVGVDTKMAEDLETPNDANADKSETLSAVDKGFVDTGVYALTPQELREKLRNAPGIGKKLTEHIAGTIEDFKEYRAGLLPEQREGIYELQSAADLMAEIPGVGMKRANLIAKELGLVEAEKVEPHDPEFDDAGFDPETEIDEATLQAGEVITVDNRNVLEKAGIPPVEPMNFEPVKKRDKSYDFAPEAGEKKPRFNTREIRQKMLKAILDTVGTAGSSAATFFDRMDAAAGRAMQNSGIAAIEQVASMSVPKYEESTETVTKPEGEKKSLLKGFLEKLPKLRLSEKQKLLLRDIGLVSGVATAAMTTGLLIEAYLYRSDEATKITNTLSEQVIRMPVPAHNWMDERVPANLGVEPQNMPQAEVLREPGVDRSSAPAEELAQAQNTADVIAAINAPVPPVGVISPAIAPNEATAFNAPPMPDMGSTIVPNEATAAQANDGEKMQLNVPVNNWMDERVPADAQANTDTAASDPQSEARLFMPTLGEKVVASEAAAEAPESEMSVLDAGILDTECVNFLTALSKKEGTVYNPDGKNICKLIIKYMNHRNNTDWNINNPGITLTEITNIDQLNRTPDAGDIGIIPPDAVVAGIYTAATNLERVDDEEVKSILEKMMTYQITEDNMTDEQLEKVMGYGFTHQVEPPSDY